MTSLIPQRVRVLARRVFPATRSQVEQLAAELETARSDINELRADNLRIAQLHDIVVERLASLQAPTGDDAPTQNGTPSA